MRIRGPMKASRRWRPPATCGAKMLATACLTPASGETVRGMALEANPVAIRVIGWRADAASKETGDVLAHPSIRLAADRRWDRTEGDAMHHAVDWSLR